MQGIAGAVDEDQAALSIEAAFHACEELYQEAVLTRGRPSGVHWHPPNRDWEGIASQLKRLQRATDSVLDELDASETEETATFRAIHD